MVGDPGPYNYNSNITYGVQNASEIRQTQKSPVDEWTQVGKLVVGLWNSAPLFTNYTT